MATKKKQIDFSNAPKTLDDHPFFGMKLDEQQIAFRDAIWNPDIDIVFVDAKAGSGKTQIAVATSVLLVQYGLYQGIHYVVSANAEGRQGYIPGDMNQKTAPYLQGLWSALETIGEWPEKLIRGLNPEFEKEGSAFITAESESYLRGANIGSSNKKILIVDESQNFTEPNLRKTLTRLCDGSKAIVIGHKLQTDIPIRQSGFVSCMNHFKSKDNPRFAFCELSRCYRGLVAQTADEEWFE